MLDFEERGDHQVVEAYHTPREGSGGSDSPELVGDGVAFLEKKHSVPEDFQAAIMNLEEQVNVRDVRLKAMQERLDSAESKLAGAMNKVVQSTESIENHTHEEEAKKANLARLEKEVLVLQAAARESLRREVGMRRELGAAQGMSRQLEDALREAETLRAKLGEADLKMGGQASALAHSQAELQDAQLMLAEAHKKAAQSVLEMEELRARLAETKAEVQEPAAEPRPTVADLPGCSLAKTVSSAISPPTGPAHLDMEPERYGAALETQHIEQDSLLQDSHTNNMQEYVASLDSDELRSQLQHALMELASLQEQVNEYQHSASTKTGGPVAATDEVCTPAEIPEEVPVGSDDGIQRTCKSVDSEDEDPMFECEPLSPESAQREISELRTKLQSAHMELLETKEQLLIQKDETAEAERVAEQERENAWNQNEDLRREVLIKEELKALQANQLSLLEELDVAARNSDFAAGVILDLRSKIISQRELAEAQLDLERERVQTAMVNLERKLAGGMSAEEVAERKRVVSLAATANTVDTHTHEVLQLKQTLSNLKLQHAEFSDQAIELIETKDTVSFLEQEIIAHKEEIESLRSLLKEMQDSSATPMAGKDCPKESAEHDSLRWKAQCIFDRFDVDCDGYLCEDELMALMRSVNPHMSFTHDHLQSIVTEVLNQYPDVSGLPFDGLFTTYMTDGSGGSNIDHDLNVLQIDVSVRDTSEEVETVGSNNGSTPLLQDILQTIMEDVKLRAPSIVPKMKQAMEAWRLERANISPQLQQSKSAEAQQSWEIEDSDVQESELPSAPLPQCKMEQELRHVHNDQTAGSYVDEMMVLQQRCCEYEAKIAALESVPTTETDAAHLLLSEPGLGEEIEVETGKKHSVSELQMQVALLEEQVRVKEQRLQDLEQNKSLPQIWEELRRKDERVTELEAELLLTPHRLGSTIGSTPTTPQFPELTAGAHSHLECQVRELQELLEQKELQVETLQAAVAHETTTAATAGLNYNEVIQALEKKVEVLQAELNVTEHETQKKIRRFQEHGMGATSKDEPLTDPQVAMDLIKAENISLLENQTRLQNELGMLRLSHSSKSVSTPEVDQTKGTVQSCTAETQTPSSFKISNMEVDPDQVSKAAARVEVPISASQGHGRGWGGASVSSSLVSSLREDDVRSMGELAKRVAEREEQLALQQQQLQQAEAEMDELIELMSASEARLTQVEGSITQKVEEVESLRNALESAKRVGLEADEKAAEANAAGTLAAATADLMQDKIQEMDRKATQAREALDKTLAELNQEKEKGTQEHAVVTALRREMEELRNQLQQQECTVKTKTSQLLQTEMQLTKLRANMNQVASTTRFKQNPHEPDFKRRVLFSGGKFIKHGTDGRPRERVVWLMEDMQSICWARSRTQIIGSHKMMPIADIKRVIIGKETPITSQLKGVVESQIFSLECTTRTIDLQVPPKGNGMTRDMWASLFTWIIEDRNGCGESLQQTYNPVFDTVDDEPTQSPGNSPLPDAALQQQHVTADDIKVKNGAMDNEGPGPCGKAVHTFPEDDPENPSPRMKDTHIAING